MFELTFKNIDDIFHKDAGCSSELDYIEQTSLILFLKYLDDLKRDRATSAELTDKEYAPLIQNEYQWHSWAAPKVTSSKGLLNINQNILPERLGINIGQNQVDHHSAYLISEIFN